MNGKKKALQQAQPMRPLQGRRRAKWVCEICGNEYVSETDSLAHQLHSECEKELNWRQYLK